MAALTLTSSDPPPSGSVITSGRTMSTNTSCAPSGTTLTLMARNTKFDPDCLTAPAGRALTIDFDNQDSLPHNLSLYTADPMVAKNVKSLFQGTLVTGPTKTTYSVPALPAGRYYFNCAVHPQMFGTFVVK
jgi:plastocyanin